MALGERERENQQIVYYVQMEWESSKRWVKNEKLAMHQSILLNEEDLCIVIRILASKGGDLKWNLRRGKQVPKFRTEIIVQGN